MYFIEVKNKVGWFNDIETYTFRFDKLSQALESGLAILKSSSVVSIILRDESSTLLQLNND